MLLERSLYSSSAPPKATDDERRNHGVGGCSPTQEDVADEVVLATELETGTVVTNVENSVELPDVLTGTDVVIVDWGGMLLALPPRVNTPWNGTPTVAVKLAVMGTPEPLAAPNVGVTVVVKGTTVTRGSAVAKVMMGSPNEPVEVTTPLKEDVIVVVEPPEPVVVTVVSALRWCQSPAAPAEERGGRGRGERGPRQRTAIAMSGRGPDAS